jgi:hypothetical protein
MITPGRNLDDDEEAYFGRTNTKYITVSGPWAFVNTSYAAKNGANIYSGRRTTCFFTHKSMAAILALNQYR